MPVPAGPMAKTIVCESMASTYRFWFSVFGRIVRPRADRMSSVSTSSGRAAGRLRSIETVCSTTSADSSVPLVTSLVSSPKSRATSAVSVSGPVTVISLPRT